MVTVETTVDIDVSNPTLSSANGGMRKEETLHKKKQFPATVAPMKLKRVLSRDQSFEKNPFEQKPSASILSPIKKRLPKKSQSLISNDIENSHDTVNIPHFKIKKKTEVPSYVGLNDQPHFEQIKLYDITWATADQQYSYVQSVNARLKLYKILFEVYSKRSINQQKGFGS